MAVRRLAVTFARGCQPWSPQVMTPTGFDPSVTYNQAFDDLGATKDFSWTGPLPDIVLAPLSTVAFMVGYTGGPNAAIVISDSVVTLTQEAVASTVVAKVEPLWLPIQTDPPGES